VRTTAARTGAAPASGNTGSCRTKVFVPKDHPIDRRQIDDELGRALKLRSVGMPTYNVVVAEGRLS